MRTNSAIKTIAGAAVILLGAIASVSVSDAIGDVPATILLVAISSSIVAAIAKEKPIETAKSHPPALANELDIELERAERALRNALRDERRP
jgi:hypothetical protein